ncbi:MAG: ABC transporter permease [Planctomycetota bacterium]|nr:ABC transporter permease [Planctomycetota bacterium]
MNFFAIKMLVGDRAKYIGIIMGLTFASLLITQQAAIFLGLMTRTYSFVSDTPQPDLWVMDPEVQHHADNKPLLDRELYRVRGVEGVAWAVPMFKSFVRLKLPNGAPRQCILIGLDDATLMGAPAEFVSGSAEDLRRSDAVLVNIDDVNDKLGYKNEAGIKTPVQVGDTLELNDRRGVIAGTFRISKAFFWEPVIYTTYTRALQFSPRERKQMSYVLVKAKPGVNIEELRKTIEAQTGLAAYTSGGFSWLTANYILEKTGIAINFGIAVLLGFIVGTAVAGQTFYNFTLDNLRHFGALKALGTGNWTLLRMILVQALSVGIVGYGLGVGGAAFFGKVVENSDLAFFLPWQLLAMTGVAVLAIVVIASLLSIRKVLTLEPAIVFKG